MKKNKLVQIKNKSIKSFVDMVCDTEHIDKAVTELNNMLASGCDESEIVTKMKDLNGSGKKDIDFYFDRDLFIAGVETFDDVFKAFEPCELVFEKNDDIVEHMGIVIRLSDKGKYNMELAEFCRELHLKDIGDISDGYHTFNELYEQRRILFQTIVKVYKGKAWKSKRHEDGKPCFDGNWFIVGIDTPEGSYTYHYEMKYFDDFDCEELENGKHWDGHTDKDVTRLLSLVK